MDLFVKRPTIPSRLFLHRPKRVELSLVVEDRLDTRRVDRPDQLILQIGITNKKHMSTAEAVVIEGFRKIVAFGVVAEANDFDGQAFGEPADESTDRMSAADRHDDDVFGLEIAPEPERQRLDGDLIANSFDEDDGTGGRSAFEGGSRCSLRRVSSIFVTDEL